MHYEGTVIRPPSEADSILLQITVGCSHNRCTFCGAYKDDRFAIKSNAVIRSDVAFAAKHYPDSRRLFLLSGDALIIPQERLIAILQMIREHLPRIIRVGIYGNAKSLKRKSVDDLIQLKKLGLGIVYLGLESGDDVTLERVRKKGNVAEITAEGRKVKEAGIKLSVTVLLGLAGSERSLVHARKTGGALSEMDPEYVGALSLMLIPGTILHDEWERGDFILPDKKELFRELREMVLHTRLSRGLFMANHASNYLPLKIRMPKDKAAALETIDRALSGGIRLRPEWARGL